MLRLVEIKADGTLAEPLEISEFAREMALANVENYKREGFEPPWVGYFAFEDKSLRGGCGFKTPIRDNKVEIAYFTLPRYEGQGHATEMASLLVKLAKSKAPGIRVTAQTLPEANVSTRILTKLGFKNTGESMHPDDGKVWDWELLYN